MKQKQETLAQRVAINFSPKPWKHEYKFIQAYGKGNVRVGDLFACEKCGQQQRKLDGQTLKNHLCDYPDPIDITDLGKALERMRIIRRTNDDAGKVAFVRAAYKVSGLDRWEIFKLWVMDEATAEQIWEICCDAKENSNE